MEYNVRNSGDRIFKDSLRSDHKSNFYSHQRENTADFHTYQNWNSLTGRKDSIKKSRIQKDLIHRLTTGSPSREHTINYVIGSGDKYQIGQGIMGDTRRHSRSSFQGYTNTYVDYRKQNTEQKRSCRSNLGNKYGDPESDKMAKLLGDNSVGPTNATLTVDLK